LREAVILFTVGDTRFAIAAGAVEEIRSREGLAPLASLRGRTTGVRNTLERRGRRHFVIESDTHLGMLPTRLNRVLVLRGNSAAILVGSIDRMQEIHALYSLPRAFRGEERQWYRGLALLHDGVVPVLDPASFVEKAELMRQSLPGETVAAVPGVACV
jgi:chemotaxis signal transduction protein